MYVLPANLRIEFDNLFEVMLIWIIINNQRNCLYTAWFKVCGQSLPSLLCRTLSPLLVTFTVSDAWTCT